MSMANALGVFGPLGKEWKDRKFEKRREKTAAGELSQRKWEAKENVTDIICFRSLILHLKKIH